MQAKFLISNQSMNKYMRLTTKLLVLVALLGAVSACRRKIEEPSPSANQVEPLPEVQEEQASGFKIPFFNLGRNQDDATLTDPVASEDPSIIPAEAPSTQSEQPIAQAEPNATDPFGVSEDDSLAQGTTVISESAASTTTGSSATTGSSGTVVYEDNEPIRGLW